MSLLKKEIHDEVNTRKKSSAKGWIISALIILVPIIIYISAMYSLEGKGVESARMAYLFARIGTISSKKTFSSISYYVGASCTFIRYKGIIFAVANK